MAARDARGADGVAWVRVPESLRALFAEADRLPAARFEVDVRILMHKVRFEQEANVGYEKLCDDAMTRLRERLAETEQSPRSRSEIEAERKRRFLRE